MTDRSVDHAQEKDGFISPWIWLALATIGYAHIQGQKLRQQLSEMDLAATGRRPVVAVGWLVPVTAGRLVVALVQDLVVDSLADGGHRLIQTPFVAGDKQLDVADPAAAES